MSISEWEDGGGWLFEIAPVPGESFGHYLGRFRRANCLSRVGLAAFVAVDVRIVRGWEMPSYEQPVNSVQLTRVAPLLGLTVAEVVAMLPEARSQRHLATRLCPTCYSETPVHRNAWQRAGVNQCECHQQPLLAACPGCQVLFRLPALWERGCCDRCLLPFDEMSLLPNRC